MRAFFLFGSKGFNEAIRLSETGRWRLNRSPNAPRLLSPALHPNRDAFKTVVFSEACLKMDCAAVEAGSTAIETVRDT